MLSRADLVGFGLVAALALWTSVSSAGRPARPGPALILLGLVAVGYLGALLVVRRIPAARTALPAAVALGIATAVLGAPDGLSGHALAGPLGYGNANGALCALGAGAAAMAGLSRPRVGARWVGVLAAAGFVVLANQTASRAGTAVAIGVALVATVLVARPSAGRAAPALAALAVAGAVATTVALALVGPTEEFSATRLGEALSDRRVVLWSESVDLLGRDPVRGVGPGRFQDESPTALADPDAAWAHSVWLQQAAETGVPGLVLLLALAGWAVLRPAGGSLDDGVTALGSVVVAGVLVHASIDYVLHFGVVGVTAAVLLGTARRAPLCPSRYRHAGLSVTYRVAALT